MKRMIYAMLMSCVLVSGCGSYATWTPREAERSVVNPADCQKGIGICPGRYGRAAQMRRE
jgi:hypothetical protein